MNETTAADRSGSEPPAAGGQEAARDLDRLADPDRRRADRRLPRLSGLHRARARRSRISFETAEGLEAGKTKMRYLDVEVGTVAERASSAPTSSTSSSPREMVPAPNVPARATPPSGSSSRASGVGGVSGLGTLLSGAYIGLAPGEGAATPERSPAWSSRRRSAPTCPGREYVLTAPTLGSVSPGAPIYYRGIDIGQVLDYQLTPDARGSTSRSSSRSRSSNLVRTTSRFWNASGINVVAPAPPASTSQVASLQSLLVGGIEFDTPLGHGQRRGRRRRDQFPALSQPAGAGAGAVHPEDPVPGLFRRLGPRPQSGCPGRVPRHHASASVTSVGLEFDPATAKIRIPVTHRDRAAAPDAERFRQG